MNRRNTESDNLLKTKVPIVIKLNAIPAKRDINKLTLKYKPKLRVIEKIEILNIVFKKPKNINL